MHVLVSHQQSSNTSIYNLIFLHNYFAWRIYIFVNSNNLHFHFCTWTNRRQRKRKRNFSNSTATIPLDTFQFALPRSNPTKMIWPTNWWDFFKNIHPLKRRGWMKSESRTNIENSNSIYMKRTCATMKTEPFNHHFFSRTFILFIIIILHFE